MTKDKSNRPLDADGREMTEAEVAAVAALAEKTRLDAIEAASKPKHAGFVFKLFGKDAKTPGKDGVLRKAGMVIAKNKGETVLVVHDVKHPFPATAEALAFMLKNDSLTVVDVDGAKWEYTGVDSAARKYCNFKLEEVRSQARSGKVTADFIRGEFLALYEIGAADESGSKAVATETDLAKFREDAEDPAAELARMKAWVRQMGLIAKAPQAPVVTL